MVPIPDCCAMPEAGYRYECLTCGTFYRRNSDGNWTRLTAHGRFFGEKIAARNRIERGN